MPDIEPTAVSSVLPDARVDNYSGNRCLRWFEVALVLTIAIARPLLAAVYLLERGPGAADFSGLRWWSGTFYEVSALLLLWYVLKRSGRRLADLGLHWSLRDIKVGMLIAIVAVGFYVFGAMLLQAIHFAIYRSVVSGPTARQFFPKPTWVAVPYYLLSPFFEELIVRAYLMTEIRGLTGSATLAVVVSVAIQTAYHLYYGWWGALSIGFMFLAFSVYYARWRRALPVIAAHEFFDLLSLLRLR